MSFNQNFQNIQNFQKIPKKSNIPICSYPMKKTFNLLSYERNTTREFKKYPSRVVVYHSLEIGRVIIAPCVTHP